MCWLKQVSGFAQKMLFTVQLSSFTLGRLFATNFLPSILTYNEEWAKFKLISNFLNYCSFPLTYDIGKCDFWDRLSLCSPDFPGIHDVAKTDLEHLILLSPHPRCWLNWPFESLSVHCALLHTEQSPSWISVSVHCALLHTEQSGGGTSLSLCTPS